MKLTSEKYKDLGCQLLEYLHIGIMTVFDKNQLENIVERTLNATLLHLESAE